MYDGIKFKKKLHFILNKTPPKKVKFKTYLNLVKINIQFVFKMQFYLIAKYFKYFRFYLTAFSIGKRFWK